MEPILLNRNEPFFYFMLTYLVAINLVWIYALFRYVAMGIGGFRMMNKLRIRNACMAWIPLCNLYALGDLADNYNLLHEAKATDYSKILLIGKIIATVAGFYLFIVLYALAPGAETTLDFWLHMLVPVAVLAAYHVLYCIVLYKIYRLFAPAKAVLLLVLSILADISVPVIFLKISAKEPCLPFEKSNETRDQEPSYSPRYDSD